VSREAASTARRQREARVAQALPAADTAVLLEYPVAPLEHEPQVRQWSRNAPEAVPMAANQAPVRDKANLPTPDP
jgi:hypothetical protein